MTFDELLVLLPGLRRLRRLNAEMLRILLDRQRRRCTWCDQKAGPGRSTWCSDACVEAFRRRCDDQHGRRIVERESRGICAACGRDTIASEREFLATHGLGKRWMTTDREVLAIPFGYARGHWREVDHVVPVIEYGGLCGPEGLRLLCGVCHEAETATLRKRLSKV